MFNSGLFPIRYLLKIALQSFFTSVGPKYQVLYSQRTILQNLFQRNLHCLLIFRIFTNFNLFWIFYGFPYFRILDSDNWFFPFRFETKFFPFLVTHRAWDLFSEEKVTFVEWESLLRIIKIRFGHKRLMGKFKLKKWLILTVF